VSGQRCNCILRAVHNRCIGDVLESARDSDGGLSGVCVEWPFGASRAVDGAQQGTGKDRNAMGAQSCESTANKPEHFLDAL